MGKNNKTGIVKNEFDNEEEQIEEELSSALQYFDKIEELLENVPDKRKTEYKNWKIKANDLITKCNKLVGSKIYNKIKQKI